MILFLKRDRSAVWSFGEQQKLWRRVKDWVKEEAMTGVGAPQLEEDSPPPSHRHFAFPGHGIHIYGVQCDILSHVKKCVVINSG